MGYTVQKKQEKELDEMSAKANDSKQRILATAIDLIKEKGYNSVTLNDICATANVSKNTFYYYFKSKEDLLIHFYGIPTNKIKMNLASILMEEVNIEQYWKLIEPMLDFIVDNGPEIIKNMIYALINQHMLEVQPSKFGLPNSDVVNTIIKRAQSSNEIRNSSDPVLLANAIRAQVLGIILFWCTENGEFDLKNEIRLILEVCFDVKPELRKATTNTYSKT